jgi:hypothetical protein
MRPPDHVHDLHEADAAMTQRLYRPAMYVWCEWPQFFRGAGALVQRLRLSPSTDAVRARLIWLAISLPVESVVLDREPALCFRSRFERDVRSRSAWGVHLLSGQQFADREEL